MYSMDISRRYMGYMLSMNTIGVKKNQAILNVSLIKCFIIDKIFARIDKPHLTVYVGRKFI